MNTDKELLASERQAITGTAVSADSVIVRGLGGYGRATSLRAFAQVRDALAGGAATGLTVELIEADDAALTVNVRSLHTTGVVPAGAGVAQGRRLIDVAVPEFTKPFAGFRYTPAGGAFASGAITAGFVLGTETPQAARPVAESHGF